MNLAHSGWSWKCDWTVADLGFCAGVARGRRKCGPRDLKCRERGLSLWRLTAIKLRTSNGAWESAASSLSGPPEGFLEFQLLMTACPAQQTKCNLRQSSWGSWPAAILRQLRGSQLTPPHPNSANWVELGSIWWIVFSGKMPSNRPSKKTPRNKYLTFGRTSVVTP